MMAKLLAIVYSVRFWMFTLAAASIYAGLVQAHGFIWKELFDTLGLWLATVAGVGTLDSFGKNVGGTPKA
jgi:hypothetical protein